MKEEQRQAIVAQVKKRYQVISPHLTEQAKRLWAASEALAIGRGGTRLVGEATGMSRVTITKGKQAVQEHVILESARIRQRGGGRKPLRSHDPQLLEALNALIDPCTRGEPESPLRWTCKSTYQLAEALQAQGHRISQRSVYALLQEGGYSLQSNRKLEEGTQHPDRDAQFQHINRLVKRFQRHGQPVISVDTKKKETIGNFAKAGQEWERHGQPRRVNTYDFPDKDKGKACPYGVFELTNKEGWMNVGISRDTAEFAVGSIRRWWKRMGQPRYPQARELLITADGGGRGGYRTRWWKRELQQLANELGLSIRICHFPPGTSKWNKIEHRMFSLVTKNWRGRPLDSLATVVNLIANTTTEAGFHIEADIDGTVYEKGIAVSDEEMGSLNIKRDKFHGEWNYKIMPQK
jgi:transposase